MTKVCKGGNEEGEEEAFIELGAVDLPGIIAAGEAIVRVAGYGEGVVMAVGE